MTPAKKWTKEGVEAYLALHPNVTLEEIGKDMGVSKQRVHQVLKSLDIKLPGRTEKLPVKRGSRRTQARHARQELVQPDKSEVLARYSRSRAKLILVTPLSDGELVEAIRSGASAYLAREANIEEEAEELGHVGSRPQVSPLAEKPYRLTKREMEVLRHVAGGSSHSEIGKALGISEQTVKNHMSLALRKLHAANKVHAVMLALQYGLLSLDEIAPSQSMKQPDATRKQ
jgi:DNA-binding NarL/FixJ family response regulator